MCCTLACSTWITREFLKAILDFSFNVAKVNCIISTVSSKNHKSLRLVKHFGSKQIGVISHAMPDGDMVIFSLNKQDCIKFM
jgi:RimJ/RimL family protein N-acetyltransferase